METWLNGIVGKASDYIMSAGVRLVFALLLLVLGFKLIKLPIRMLNKSKGFSKLDKTAQSFLTSLIKAVLDILLIVTCAAILGVPMTNVAAVIASAGLAIGLALQGSLSNFAGGIMILVFKPFSVGDYITTNGNSGTVRDINIFYTHLLTPDNQVVMLPNSAVSNSALTNYSTMPRRRVDFSFNVSYDSDIDKVRKVILDSVSAYPFVLRDPEPAVFVSSHKDSAVEILLRIWCESADYWTAYYGIRESVKKTFDENGIVIPFPQLDIHSDCKK